jgi:hypothetical protein
MCPLPSSSSSGACFYQVCGYDYMVRADGKVLLLEVSAY